MKSERKRNAAITIEYLIFSIVILGVGACLLGFQGEIKNIVTMAQSNFASLQENMTESQDSTEPVTHSHHWKYEVSQTEERVQTTVTTERGTRWQDEVNTVRFVDIFSEKYIGTNPSKVSEGMWLDYAHHYCPECGVIEQHSYVYYNIYCTIHGLEQEENNIDYICSTCKIEVAPANAEDPSCNIVAHQEIGIES